MRPIVAASDLGVPGRLPHLHMGLPDMHHLASNKPRRAFHKMSTKWPLGVGPFGPTFASFSVGQPFTTHDEVMNAVILAHRCQMQIDYSATNGQQLEAAAAALLAYLCEELKRLRPPPRPARPICKVPDFFPLHRHQSVGPSLTAQGSICVTPGMRF